jgi:hypothetical protein
LVDDSSGRPLPIEVLSHGTREQLFLSLRLALVGLFARRGIALPLVLDDVLVNFDASRAKAAIEMLHEFSKRGHQILMLTCHEHIAGFCKSQELDVRRLPDHRTGKLAEMTVEPMPKKHRARRAKDTVTQLAPIAELAATPTATLAILPTPSDVAPAPTPPPSPMDHSQAFVISAPAVSHFRIDLPEPQAHPPAIMRRWGAEEFSGELDDRVNPLWLLNGDEITSSSKTVIGSSLDTPDRTAIPAVARPHKLRLFSHSSPIVVEPAQGDEDWDL